MSAKILAGFEAADFFLTLEAVNPPSPDLVSTVPDPETSIPLVLPGNEVFWLLSIYRLVVGSFMH